MRKGFLASLPALLVGASLVLGQPPLAPAPKAAPPEGEPAPAPAGPAAASPPPTFSVLDGLATHFDGTCGRLNSNVLVFEADYLLWVLKNGQVDREFWRPYDLISCSHQRSASERSAVTTSSPHHPTSLPMLH